MLTRDIDPELGKLRQENQSSRISLETLSKNARERKEIDRKIIEYILWINSNGMCLLFIYVRSFGHELIVNPICYWSDITAYSNI